MTAEAPAQCLPIGVSVCHFQQQGFLTSGKFSAHIGMPLYNSSQLGSNFNDVITEYNYKH